MPDITSIALRKAGCYGYDRDTFSSPLLPESSGLRPGFRDRCETFFGKREKYFICGKSTQTRIRDAIRLIGGSLSIWAFAPFSHGRGEVMETIIAPLKRRKH